MIGPLPNRSTRDVVGPSFHLVTADGIAPVGALDRLPAGLDSLVEQEVSGHRREQVPPRLAELFDRLGFGWEPVSEPGHMRMIDHAAFMLRQATDHAERVAGSVFDDLDIPYTTLAGISLVNPAAPVMPGYLALTAAEPDLYGDAPYEVRAGGCSYMLRQTSCVQKYSACLSRDLVAGSLPAALFEISDSFRREPAETLQLSYRLRRFHLPEAHVHADTIASAVDTSQGLHQRILRTLAGLDASVALLISATHEFAAAHQRYFTELAGLADAPALLKVSPPGHLCEDGVEVDLEYKIVDSLGCCRELSTFQIDERITRSFGIRCDDGRVPATIHAVLTGGVERYLFFALDRIVRAEATGGRPHLPLWLSAVVARVVPARPGALGAAAEVAGQLARAGIRTELDDRDQTVDVAVRDADALLVPYVVVVNDAPDGPVAVRDYTSATYRDRRLHDLITEVRAAEAVPPAGLARRMSRRPISGPNSPGGVL